MFNIGGLPNDIKSTIYQFVADSIDSDPFDPEVIIKEKACVLKNLIADKLAGVACEVKLKELHANYLVRKYTTSDTDAEDPDIAVVHLDPDSVLINAVKSGCRFTDYDIGYSPEVESDIIDIIKLLPSSINTGFGKLKGRAGRASVLEIACLNPNIPVQKIVRKLLQNGANPLQEVQSNGDTLTIWDNLNRTALRGCIDLHRIQEINALFEAFHLDPEA